MVLFRSCFRSPAGVKVGLVLTLISSAKVSLLVLIIAECFPAFQFLFSVHASILNNIVLCHASKSTSLHASILTMSGCFEFNGYIEKKKEY